MTLTPSEIKAREFGRSLRGYDPAEVTRFLADAAARLEESEKARQKLSDKAIELETRLKDFESMEKALHQTFLQAQETSGKAVENARKEAQLIIQEAEVKASQILEKARTDLAGMNDQVAILRTKRSAIASRLKVLLASELELLRALEADGESGAAASQDAPQAAGPEIREIIKRLDDDHDAPRAD